MSKSFDNFRVRRLPCSAMLALVVLTASAAPLSTLEQRMQLFQEGSLRGFALAELPESGGEGYSESDFRDLAATGANVVRVAISLRKCSGCERYDEPDAAIRYVERILDRGERYGFRVVVTLVPTPGFSRSDYWDNPALKADIVRHWGQVAMRLRRFAALQAYDLVNEPVGMGGVATPELQRQWHELATAIAHEVRQADPDTPLMVEPAPWGLPGSFRQTLPLRVPGVVYSFHLYAPHEFTHQGLPGYGETLAYPGNGWDRKRLSRALDEARRFAAAHKVPMFVGEFSCVRWAPAGSCQRYLADAISLLEGEGWGWAYHCWRCYQGWDAEIAENIPREQRSGRLPEHRRADSSTLLLLKGALERNRSARRN